MSERPIAVDLFCGVGGMSLGFQQAGFRVVLATDINDISLAAHKRNFPRAETIEADIETLTSRKIRSKARIGRRRIDVVFGGPPCQGFSVGGTNDARDPRNKLILEFARLVVELGPRYFVMENVGGLLLRRHARILKKFISKLRAGGFEVITPIRRLNAADFGVPQRRKRAFIVGCKKGETSPEYPAPTTDRVTVGDAIDDLLCVETSRLKGDGVYRGKLGPPSAYAKELRARPKGRKKTRELSGFVRTEHTMKTQKRFSRVTPGGVDVTSRFIRLERDGVAPTLRAGTGFDRGRFMAPRPIHPDFPRCITLREAARLHSYPDWFVFDETKWHGFMQIGNSVPPRLARAVAKTIRRALRSG